MISDLYERWLIVEVATPGPRPEPDREAPEEVLLNWCLDAAIGEFTAARPRDDRGDSLDGPRRLDWRSVLRRIRRDRLDRALRPAYEDLLIDARESGTFDDLQAWLARIPADERRPRVWQALETAAMARLSHLASERELRPGFRAGPRPLGRGHPPRLSVGSEFPAAHRKGSLRWSRRMPPTAGLPGSSPRQGRCRTGARPGEGPHVGRVAAERDRIAAKVGHERVPPVSEGPLRWVWDSTTSFPLMALRARPGIREDRNPRVD